MPRGIYTDMKQQQPFWWQITAKARTSTSKFTLIGFYINHENKCSGAAEEQYLANTKWEQVGLQHSSGTVLISGQEQSQYSTTEALAPSLTNLGQ